MRRDSRPGQAPCRRLVTKRTKFKQHFAFMPPFSNWQKAAGLGSRPSEGDIEFAAQRHPRAIPLGQVKRHVAQDCEIAGAVIVTISRSVLLRDGR